MSDRIKPPRTLFCVSIALFLAFAGTVYFIAKTQLPPSITIKTTGQPTIGYAKARVHVVAFEEPKCSHCRDYSNDIFPTIKKEFIDTNKILYTLIPVSFLPGSMPAAVASLCVYNQTPLYPNDELFIKFFDTMYQNQPEEQIDWATPKTLVEYARATSPAIHPDLLEKCVEMETFRVQIEKNTAYGREIMGGTLITPTVYVNGIKVQELTLDEVRKLILEVLEHEGIE